MQKVYDGLFAIFRSASTFHQLIRQEYLSCDFTTFLPSGNSSLPVNPPFFDPNVMLDESSKAPPKEIVYVLAGMSFGLVRERTEQDMTR